MTQQQPVAPCAIPVALCAMLVALCACNETASEPDIDAAPDAATLDISIGEDAAGDVAVDANVDVSIVACSDEDSRANLSAANAAPIAPGDAPAAGVLCQGTEDWFRVDARAGQRIAATLTFTNRDGDLALARFDAADPATPLDEVDTQTDNESMNAVAEQDGTYLFRVTSSRGDAPYTIDIAVSCAADDECAEGLVCSFLQDRCVTPTSACGDDAFEPNDSAETGVDVAFAADGVALYHGANVCAGDEDYYVITLDAPTTLRGTLDADPGNEVTMAFYALDGTPERGVSEADEGGGARLDRRRAAPGTYVIAVRHVRSGGENTTYYLTLEAEPDTCAGDIDCAQPGIGVCEAGACVSFTPDAPGGPGAPCDSGGDCVDALGCFSDRPGIAENFCTRECENVEACGDFDDATCLNVRGGGVCYPACAQDDDCPDLYHCGDDARCARQSCGFDGDCDAPRVCRYAENNNDGYCTAQPSGACDTPDAHEPNDASTDAQPLGDGLDGLTICDRDDDWFTVDVAEDGTTLKVSARFETDADIDVFVLDSAGRTVGEGTQPDARPELAVASALRAGRYYVRVNQFPGDADQLTEYSLRVETSEGTCTTEGRECDLLEPMRIVCDEDSASCTFLEGAGGVALGERCDSDDDCVPEANFCWRFSGARDGANVCTVRCSTDDPDACDNVPGTSCQSFGRGFAACVVSDDAP